MKNDSASNRLHHLAEQQFRLVSEKLHSEFKQRERSYLSDCAARGLLSGHEFTNGAAVLKLFDLWAELIDALALRFWESYLRSSEDAGIRLDERIAREVEPRILGAIECWAKQYRAEVERSSQQFCGSDEGRFSAFVNHFSERIEASKAKMMTLIQNTHEKQSSAFVTWVGATDLVNLAIVFTDIIGSTWLNTKFGDAKWDEIRSAHFDYARNLADKHNGYFIDARGDQGMAAFRNSMNALCFARELEANTGHEVVRIRAGIHVGQVFVKEGDALDSQTNLTNQTSRIMNKAENGGIWVSDRVREDWRNHDPGQLLPWTKHDDVELKGFPDRFTLWSLPPSTGETPPS